MEKIHKIYLALLNGGYIRREFAWVTLPTLRGTKGVEIIWENPGLTWSNPISSNRNLITKRFLQTDCEWLLMLDDDVVPHCNPAELVYADKDVVGFPARVRSNGRTIVWTAYRDHPSGEHYAAVDLTQLDDIMDLMEVEIVGTGCILIHRRVLEVLKAPFHSEFDEDGIQIYGTDFAFCRKARNAGFHVFTAPNYICEHYKEVGLNDIQGFDDIRHFNNINAKYEFPWGGWAISQKDWQFIDQILHELNPRRVLEFGCGLSSLLMSEFVEVVSYETNPLQIKEIEGKKTKDNKLTIKEWDGKNLELDQQFDLAFVDGPPGENTGGIGRHDSIRIASDNCKVIIIHDAGRDAEKAWQRKHLRGKFAMIRNSGDHDSRCALWVLRPKQVTNANFFEAENQVDEKLSRE